MAAACRHYTPTGHRVGETHHNAKLTDAEVALLRTMHKADGVSYTVLASTFGIARTTAAQLCRNERRQGAGGA